jgi:type I restriction enzyme, R subunit
VQRLKTQLDQYTDLNDAQKAKIEQLIPEEQLRSFRSSYLEIAKKFKEVQQKDGDKVPSTIQQLDFEFVLFASAVVDYDYIMNLIDKYTQGTLKKQKK